jgi:hypothetical protein
VEPFGVAQRDLRRVQRLAGRLEDARVQLRDAILAAHDSGESVRDIAPYAGMSPSRVHELLVEARDAAGADEP